LEVVVTERVSAMELADWARSTRLHGRPRLSLVARKFVPDSRGDVIIIAFATTICQTDATPSPTNRPQQSIPCLNSDRMSWLRLGVICHRPPISC